MRTIARLSLWLLLALSVPFAALMLWGGIVWGVWMHASLLNTFTWLVEVTSPIWIALTILGSRAYPQRSLLIAVMAWAAMVGLFSWNLLYGVLEDRRAEAVFQAE
jgi:predicted neutral ceramidase superfamily lipid hydrolase